MECAVCGRPLRRHNKTGFCYLHCRKGATQSIEIIRRKCLRCDKEFNAVGRLNRICPICHESNKQIVNASRYRIPWAQLGIGHW